MHLQLKHIILLTWLYGLVVACPKASAQRYVKISAEINFTTFRFDHTNTPVAHKPIHIICTMGTNEWRIDNDYSDNARLFRYFDGTNVYASSQLTGPVPEVSKQKIIGKFGLIPASFVAANSNIQINVHAIIGGHPFGDEGVNLPWLAFCSGTYFKMKGRIIPPGCSDLPSSPDAYAYTDQSKVFNDELGLPTLVDLYTSDSLHETAINNYLYKLRGEKPRHRDGFGDGHLKFHYQVIESTNFEGWNFPLKFEFSQNDWFNGNWYLAFTGTGTVTEIARSEKPHNLFHPGKLQTIVDGRFHDGTRLVNGILYQNTNGFVSPTNDAALLKIFSERVQRAPYRVPPSQAYIKWILIGIALAGLIPLFIVFRQEYRKK